MGKTKSKNQHVVPHDGAWAVKGEGNSRVTSVHSTQREAINTARDIARNQRSEILIHGRDGQIRERDSAGHDPFPPRDRGTSGSRSSNQSHLSALRGESGSRRQSGESRRILFPVTPSTTGEEAIKRAVSEVVYASQDSSRSESRG